jgi:hypothetical protein
MTWAQGRYLGRSMPFFLSDLLLFACLAAGVSGLVIAVASPLS